MRTDGAQLGLLPPFHVQRKTRLLHTAVVWTRGNARGTGFAECIAVDSGCLLVR